MNTDKVNIPVDIVGDPAVAKVVAEIKARFVKEFQNITIQNLTGAVPFTKTTLTGSQQFQTGGKTFEVIGRGKVDQPPEAIIGESGELNIAEAMKFAATIREVKEKLNEDITAEGKRLKQFKDSIKFQPLSTKQEALKRYIEEFGDINNELTSRLEKINQIVARKDFDKLKARISQMSPEEGIKEYEKYMQSNEALVDRAVVERKKLVEIFKRNVIANQKIKFNQVRDRISGLDIKDQITELEKLIPTVGGEFQRLLNQQLGKLKDQVKNISFKEVKAEANLAPLEKRAKIFQKYIEDGGAFVERANREIQRAKNALAKQDIKNVRLDAALKPLEEQEKFFEDFRKSAGDIPAELNRQIDREIAKIRDKMKGLRFRDVKTEASLEPTLDKREQLFRDYIASGGEFVKEAEQEIRKIQNTLKRSAFRDAKTLALTKPLEDRETFWNDFARSNQEFADQVQAEIQKTRSSLSRKRFSEAKITASLKPIEEQEKFWKEYSVQNNDFSDRVVKEWKTARDKVRGKTFRETKADAAVKAIENREQVWQSYINSGGEFVDEANREIAKIRTALSKKKFKSIRSNISVQPLEQQILEYQQLITTALDPDQMEQVKRELEKVKTRLTRRKFQETKDKAAALPIEQREQLFQQWIHGNKEFTLEASIEIRKIRTQLAKKILGEAKADALLKPIQDREAFWNQFKMQNQQLATEADREIQKVRNAISKRAFTEAKMDILLKSVEQREQLWNQFKAQNAQFSKEVDREIQKVRRQMNQKTFTDFKTSLIGKTVEDQIQAWKAFIATNNEFTDVGNAQIKKLTAQWVTNTKNLSKQKFRTWLKGLQTIDPAQALTELDAYITAPFSKFVDDAKIMRDRMKKSMQSTTAQMAKERQRQMSNLILLGAGAGLGLLGPAGFPLLNVGFAAMSGGVPGAVVVGFMTALGETIRVIEEYRQAHISAAKELGAIPTSFKLVEARIKGFEAILGAISLSSQATGMEERLKLRIQNGANVAGFEGAWTQVIESFKTQGEKYFQKPSDVWKDILSGNFIAPFSTTLSNQKAVDNLTLESRLDSAYRNMIIAMNKSNVGIETDPYETWKRMQQAAFDPTKQMEMELMREQVKYAKELLELVRERNKKDLAEEKNPIKFPVLMTGFF